MIVKKVFACTNIGHSEFIEGVAFPSLVYELFERIITTVLLCELWHSVINRNKPF